MANDLQLSDQDEVLLESLVLAASDNVARAPPSDRDQFAPERRRAFVETGGDENVYLGTGNAWVDVSENTGLLSSLFGGGDGNFDSVNTDAATIGGQESDYQFELVESVSDSGTSSTVSVPVSKSYDQYEIRYFIDHRDSSGGVLLQAGGQSNGGAWSYIDETGTLTTGADGGLLFTAEPVDEFGGIISTTQTVFAEQGLDHSFTPHRFRTPIGVAFRFGNEKIKNWDSVDFVPAGSFDAIEVELYGRNKR